MVVPGSTIRRIAAIMAWAAIAAAAGADTSPIEAELFIGVSVDVAPFGIEYVTPEIGVFVWFRPPGADFNPGALLKFSGADGRADGAFAMCVRTRRIESGTIAWGPLCYAGLIADFAAGNRWGPYAGVGLSGLGSNGLLGAAGASLRAKPGDTDTELHVAAGTAMGSFER